MIIHYMNAKGEEKTLTNIIFMQNINNDEWEAITEDNKILTLVTSRIEAVFDEIAKHLIIANCRAADKEKERCGK